MARGWIETTAEADAVVIRAFGHWNLAAVATLRPALDQVAPAPAAAVVMIDLGGIEILDTVGAVLILQLGDRLVAAGHAVAMRGVRREQRGLLDLVNQADRAAPLHRPRRSALLALIERVGRATIDFGARARDIVAFLGQVTISVVRTILNPSRLRVTALVYHMEQVGLNALPITGLLVFLIGVVTAYQGADQLRWFGAEIYTVNLVAVAIVREFGVLITAIVIAGRSGSAFTAQIGTMKVNQEVDAIQTLGLDVMDVLVLPRLFSLVLTLPLLVLVADLLGLFGGAVMCYLVLDISFATFVKQLHVALTLPMLFVGIAKAPVFALVIGLVGCRQGLNVSGSAESVGRLTTMAVVECIFVVIVLDALFSVLFSYLKV
ncbi:MAG: ABC transporter permease [Azospirillaceae bacterium]|nr:ABC transporter permease [Azospirillaceae bacterium]